MLTRQSDGKCKCRELCVRFSQRLSFNWLPSGWKHLDIPMHCLHPIRCVCVEHARLNNRPGEIFSPLEFFTGIVISMSFDDGPMPLTIQLNRCTRETTVSWPISLVPMLIRWTDILMLVHSKSRYMFVKFHVCVCRCENHEIFVQCASNKKKDQMKIFCLFVWRINPVRKKMRAF